MNKKKIVIIASVCLCMGLLAATVFLFQEKDTKSRGEDFAQVEENGTKSFAQVKENFQADIQELKDGKYTNLIANDFTASIEDAEGLYNLEILRNKSYENNSNHENFEIMSEVIDKFFDGEFDKSCLIQDLYYEDADRPTEIPYHEVAGTLMDEQNPSCELGSLYGQMDSEPDYFAQIGPDFGEAWFSKRTFGTSLPGDPEIDNECLYVTGIRQEDAVIHLMDGEIQLSELENHVLDYIHGEEFPLPIGEDISYGIGTVHIMSYDESECINFALRRIYKGVPFEYGSAGAVGEYIDDVSHDNATLNYAVSTSPDTLMGFGKVNGTVVEKEEITKMFTAGDALAILAHEIGENSVYEVHGVELIYRNCEIPEEYQLEVSDILAPKWKIITINQNDDKYTLFYVDVVTGEITERFEYYYD